MNNYKCKCGNENGFFIEHNLSQCGLYCGECGKWQKWINKDEERLFRHKQNLAEHDKQVRDKVIEEIKSKLVVSKPKEVMGVMICPMSMTLDDYKMLLGVKGERND